MFWFESKDYSFVPKANIRPWTEDLEKRKALKTTKSFLDGLATAEKWRKSPGPFPEYESIENSEESSEDSSSVEDEVASEESASSASSSKPINKYTNGSLRKRRREQDEDDEGKPPVKRLRLFGSEDEPKGVRKLRVMRELGLIAPEGSPWALKKSA